MNRQNGSGNGWWGTLGAIVVALIAPCVAFADGPLVRILNPNTEVVRPQVVTAGLAAASQAAPNFLAVYTGTILLAEPIAGCTPSHLSDCPPDGFRRFELQLELPAATKAGPVHWTIKLVPGPVPANPTVLFARGAASASVASMDTHGGTGTWAVDDAWVDMTHFAGDPDTQKGAHDGLTLHAIVAVAGDGNDVRRISYHASVTGRLVGGVGPPP